MAWKDELHDASFRGVQFYCTSVSDAYNKAVAVHQAPYSDNADVEDLGIDPRKISINAIYTGSDYKQWLDALEVALAQSGAGELIHPVYGILQVQVQSWTVQHDAENVDYCTVNIEFLTAQNQFQDPFVPVATAQPLDVQAAIAPPAMALQKQLDALEKTDPDGYFATVTRIREGLQQAYQTLHAARQSVDDALSPAEWAYGLVNDVVRLLNFDVTDISALSKWRGLYNKVKKITTIFADDKLPALQQLWRATTVTAQVAAAQQIVNLTREKMAVSQLEAGLTPPELAVIRAGVRQELQQAIRDERLADDGGLLAAAQVAVFKQFADVVHGQFQALIETRPPLTTTVIEQPCTVHWLAHRLYGDFSRGTEIWRLNPTLERPSMLNIGQEVTVYAR